jgi:hypothetical protein
VKLLRKRMCKSYFLKKIRGISSPKYFSKTKGSILLRNYLYSILCNIFIALCYTNYYVYLLKRLNILHSFFGKGRTLRILIAQKTVKNKRVKLLRKRNRKLYFLEIIRGISSPKYFRKNKTRILLAKQFLLCVIPTIWLIMESPKYLLFFFGKRRTQEICFA